jgi:adenylosuccinate lyase
MSYLFSPNMKFRTWRKLWTALAGAEMKLGLPVTPAQVAELEGMTGDINYDRAAEWEKKLRHDVMAHIHAYGEQCPAAMPIIHLGATSCYVTDNTDIIIMKKALEVIKGKLLLVLEKLCAFASEYKSLPTLGFTHFQPAQLTTVGKRATLWANEFLMDLEEVVHRISTLKLLGSKGTTGTQASFLELFDGDHGKVAELERLIAEEMGFDAVVPVSGQTYSRKYDAFVLSTLSAVAQSASKFATDMRLLSHLKEIEEPFEANQVGSSAMPYKRNPMRCERVCALSRYIIADAANPAMTSATQWFERTLDDSANKRISVPEAFLAADAVLNIVINIASGFTVHEKVIAKHIQEELPFMATENILMDAVKAGGDRQRLHEKIREYSLMAGSRVKDEGLSNNLAELLADDPEFPLGRSDISSKLDASLYIGRSPEQVEEFVGLVNAVLQENRGGIASGGDEIKI